MTEAGLAPGTRLADYEIQRALGAGAMGAVYLARDTRMSRRVALKVIHGEVGQDPERRARFLREIRLTREVRDPGFVEVYDVGADDERIFLAMEFVEGVTLEQTLRHHVGPLPTRETARVLRELARALAVAHAAKIVHRDLTPDNVQLASDGRVLILDFGLAKSLEAASPTDSTAEVLTRHGTVVGSPAYMSPEQARGHTLDARSDIFSLGVIAFEMATGEKPFDANTWQDALLAVVTQAAKKAGEHGVPAPLATIIDKCLEKDPAARFQSCEEIVSAVDGMVLRERKSVVEIDGDYDPLGSTQAGIEDADEDAKTTLVTLDGPSARLDPRPPTVRIQEAVARPRPAVDPTAATFPLGIPVDASPPLAPPGYAPSGAPPTPPPSTMTPARLQQGQASLALVVLVAVVASAVTALVMYFLLARR